MSFEEQVFFLSITLCVSTAQKPLARCLTIATGKCLLWECHITSLDRLHAAPPVTWQLPSLCPQGAEAALCSLQTWGEYISLLRSRFESLVKTIPSFLPALFILPLPHLPIYVLWTHRRASPSQASWLSCMQTHATSMGSYISAESRAHWCIWYNRLNPNFPALLFGTLDMYAI